MFWPAEGSAGTYSKQYNNNPTEEKRKPQNKNPQTFFVSITFLHKLWISAQYQRTPDTCVV